MIQITNDEKFFWKNMSLDHSTYLGKENAKDIIAIAFGFDIKKTFMFLDTLYIEHLFKNVLKIQKRIKMNHLRSIFGFELKNSNNDNSPNCGQISYPAIQAAPAFSSSFPVQFLNRQMKCLIPCAIDQDPYFRLTRDVAPKMNEFKCATLYSKFIPSLHTGIGKMSASNTKSAIYLNDTPDTIKEKIFNYQFNESNEKSDNVILEYLRFFMDNDDKFDNIEKKYSNGQMSLRDIKQSLCDILVPIIVQFQEKRKSITDEMLQNFMKVRVLK